MSFDVYFFISRLPNVLSVNTESVFKLTFGLSNILHIEPLQIITNMRLEGSLMKFDFKING